MTGSKFSEVSRVSSFPLACINHEYFHASEAWEDECIFKTEFFSMEEVLPRNTDLRHCQSATQFWVLQYRVDTYGIRYNLLKNISGNENCGRKSCGSFYLQSVCVSLPPLSLSSDVQFQFSVHVFQNESSLNDWTS